METLKNNLETTLQKWVEQLSIGHSLIMSADIRVKWV